VSEIEIAERNKRVVHRLFDEVWNGRRLDVISELYTPDFVVDYRPYAPLRSGRQAVVDMVERAWVTFPDYHEELLSLVAEGDAVAVHGRGLMAAHCGSIRAITSDVALRPHG
jgi:predicted SnoaL-like aldol condensation-catalyzing enzyme